MKPSRSLSAVRTVGGAALLMWGYTAWVLRRNRRLRRPPVRGPDGLAYPSRRFTFSDGVAVTYLDTGRSGWNSIPVTCDALMF